MASDSPPSPAVAGRDIPNPTIHVPPWLNLDDPTAKIYSSSPYPLSGVSVTSDVTSPNNPYHLSEEVHAASRRFRRFRNEWSDPHPEFDLDLDSPVDFRMLEFKVRPRARGSPARGRSHDWTDCPFAHPGENARRRDPRKFHYSGSACPACPDFRKGHREKGDSCEFAHFECSFHRERYRTKLCKDGTSCKRRVCFFAHTPEQLRVLPQQSPCWSNSVNSSMESYDGWPPMSLMTGSLGSSSVSEMVAPLRKVKSLPASCNVQVGPVGSVGSPGFVSPRWMMLRSRFCSMPSTPTRSTVGFVDFCDEGCEEEIPMERVESGRDLRAKMFERLREENSQEEGTGIGFGSPVSVGGTPVLPPVNERGHNLPDIDSASLPISTGGTSVFHNVEAGRIRRMLGLLAGGIRRPESLNISMGGTSVIQTANVEGSRVHRMLAGIGLASPISTGTLVIQTGDVEAGHLLIGSRFGVSRSDITPMNNDFRMSFGNPEPQTGNYPPPLVRPLEQRSRLNCFFILFVTSEILGVVFEIIYQESHIMAYFFIWFVCAMIAMYVARLLAMIEGGRANREQFAVYLRCFSFLLLELLQYWGIHQGNYTALKIILKVTGVVIGWWVERVLKSYMDAFGTSATSPS